MDDLSSSSCISCVSILVLQEMDQQIDCSLELAQKNSAAETRTYFPVEFFSLRHFPQIKFHIIMSFRKPCHMPFHKIIPPFTLTVIKPLYTKQIFWEINSWGPPPLHNEREKIIFVA